MATLWRQGAEVFEEADVAEWAARRPGIDLARLDDLDAARVMPEGAPCPDWAQFGKARWSDAGYRILVELIDARGEVRSMRARQLGTRTPKELAPKGHEVAGLVLACPFARRVLAGHDVGDGTPARAHVARTGLLLVEGTPAWLAWLSAFSDASACAPAVVGITTGAWTEAHAAAACSGCTREQPLRVLLDVDADAGGDRIAGQVLRAFRLPMLTGSARLQRRQRIAS